MRAIIGPNGAGKTTMMDVITGKTRPDDGSVVFSGAVDLTRLDEAASGATPFPAHERAAVLDRAAVLLAERTEQFARTIAAEAAKPLRTARVAAQRAVDTFRFSAAEARTLAGDGVPLDASTAGGMGGGGERGSGGEAGTASEGAGGGAGGTTGAFVVAVVGFGGGSAGR